jgi:PAS domain S-box-containing protein
MSVPDSIIRVAYAALEQAAERVVMTDRKGTILYVNPAFERVTGYTKDEALGQTPRLLKSGLHDATFYQQLWQALLAGQSFRARFVNRRKNGQLYHEEQTIAPLRDKHGEIAYFISTAVDLSVQVTEHGARVLAEASARHLQEGAFGREERVVELKREVNALLQALGREEKYSI